jgi:hypothetical protein
MFRSEYSKDKAIYSSPPPVPRLGTDDPGPEYAPSKVTVNVSWYSIRD